MTGLRLLVVAGPIAGAGQMARAGNTGEASIDSPGAVPTDESALRTIGELVPTICWVTDARGRTLWMNRHGHAFFGENALRPDNTERLAHPDDYPSIMADWADGRRRGTSIERTVRTRGVDGRYRPLLSRAQPIRDAEGAIAGWFGFQVDLSGDSIRQRHETFLRNLSEATRGMVVVKDILDVTSQMLGRHLGVSRVAYSETMPGEYGSYRVEADWTDGSTRSLTGEWRLADVFPKLVEHFATGKTVIVTDVHSHPLIGPESAAILASIGIRAAVCAPLTKDGAEVAGIMVHQTTPRDFSTDEVRLVEDVAERTWATLTRARAEADLLERERQQAFLLEWSDRIRSETDPDRLLETSLDMLARHVGATRATYTEGNEAGDLFTVLAEWRDGKVTSIVDAVFDVKQVGVEVARQWLAGDVVLYEDIANDPRLEDWAAANFLSYDIAAVVSMPLLHDGKVRHVLSVQHNVARTWRASEVALIRDLAERLWVMLDRARAHSRLMERERMQAMLLRWSDSIRHESTPRAILSQTLSAIGEYLGVSRVNYAEVDAAGDELLVIEDWVNGAESLTGRSIPIAALGKTVIAEHLHTGAFRTDDCHADRRFDPATMALYDGVGVRAFVSIPLVKGAKLLAVLSIQQSEPRVWSDAEVELLADMAERTWAIIERARSEEQLAESEALLAGFFANAPIAMYLKDEHGRYLRLNQEMANAIELPIEEVLGKTSFDVVERSVAEQVASLDRKALTDGIQSAELKFNRAHRNHMLSIRFPIAVGEGPATLLGGFTIDLTEQRRAEAALERSRDALFQSEKLNALGSLLAGVSHELNNPLSIVVAQSVMMERQARGSDLAERAVKIRKAADRCARIVQTFLGMARQRQPERTATDLDAVAAAAVELAAYGLKTDGVTTVLDLAGTLPLIAADADQLHQVIVNLIVNAQQAMVDAGSPERRLTLRTAPGLTPDTVMLDLIDTGPGVPADARRRIFEPFFTTKPQGQGTGIGLSFSRGLAEAHGGRLELIDSTAGAHFRLTLPVHGEAAPDTAPQRAEEPAPAAARRALVVDDEREIAEALADFLSVEGFTCDIVEGGGAAKAKLIGGAYDLIVSDLRMPGVDGPELYAWLLSHRPDLARRTAFATGDTLGHAAARFLAEARRPVLEKPFMPDAVQHLLQQMELL